MNFPILLQPAPEPADAGAPAGAASGGMAGIFGSPMILVMLAMMVGMLFLTSRSENKKQKEADLLLKSLDRGMKVRTTSGILGEIVSLTDRDVTLSIAEKVRINVLRSHIAGLEAEPAAATAAEKKTA